MKNYKSISDLMHTFANLREDARFTAEGQSGNVYFSSGVLYSYGSHFPLAQYVQSKKHGLIVLMNSRSYSVTTSGHQSAARSALSQYTQIFVPLDSYNEPKNVFERYESQVKPLLTKLSKARKPAIYLEAIAQIRSSAETYAEVVNAKMPKSLLRLCSITNGSEYAAILQKEAKEREAAQKREAAQQAKEDAERLEKWRNFEGHDYVYLNSGLSALRYNANKRRIETSQQVELPLTYARQFWQMIETGKRNNDFETLIGFEVLDRFRVRSFDADKIEIGCHRIPLAEIDQIADQMQWQLPAKAVALTEKAIKQAARNQGCNWIESYN